MTRTNDKTAASKPDTDQLPNQITVIGRGVPSNFEFTVAGDIEMMTANPKEDATVVTEHAVEGAIDAGVQRFQFSGELTNSHIVDWNGVEGADSPSTPTIHVDYGVSEQ